MILQSIGVHTMNATFQQYFVFRIGMNVLMRCMSMKVDESPMKLGMYGITTK